MAFLTTRTFKSHRLLLGALLGLITLGATPGPADAQIPPLDALNAVGSILGLGQQPPRERPNTDILNGNMNNNEFDFCVLTCDLPPNLIPTGLPPVAPQARPPIPPQARPPQARPPVPTQAPRNQGPTILIPPIQL